MLLFILLVLCTAIQPHLGSLDIAGYVVPNVEFARNQWSAGTGTLFGPITQQRCKVFLPHGVKKEILLKSTRSIRNNPTLELVEANPAIGPWAPQTDSGSGPGYFGYIVDNIHQSGATLRSAGMKEIALCDSGFAFYRGINGLLFKLITSHLFVSKGGYYPTDLGPITHVDVAIQNFEGVRDQLSDALDVIWSEVSYPNTPFTFPDGTHNVDIRVGVTDTRPLIELEFAAPPLGVFGSTNTSYNYHVTYTVPAGTMDAVNTQMLDAGFVLNTYFTAEGFGLVLGYYVSPETDAWIEIVDERFDPDG